MSKASLLVIVSAAVVVGFASSGQADSPSTGQPLQPAGSEVAAAGSFIAAIKNEQTSIIQAQPKCGEGTTLSGELVMETPKRAGFPFSATTIASPNGTFTTLTTTGNETTVVIDEVARTLNNRADDYIKKLLRNCSL